MSASLATRGSVIDELLAAELADYTQMVYLPPDAVRLSGDGRQLYKAAEGTHVATTGKLAGKVALVTGGDGGLGSAMCKRLAQEGAAVAVGWFGKDPAHAQTVIDAIVSAGGQAIAVQGNVASQAD